MLPLPSLAYTFIVTLFLMIANLYGVDIFAKIQDIVAFLLVGSMMAPSDWERAQRWNSPTA